MPAHSLELPGETFGPFVVEPKRHELIDQTRNEVGAHGKASRAVLFLLALKPGPFEKGLVGKNF